MELHSLGRGKKKEKGCPTPRHRCSELRGSHSAAVTHRMFEPAVLDDWTHLLVHDHVLQVLQGGMLADLILERQHVLAHCTWWWRRAVGVRLILLCLIFLRRFQTQKAKRCQHGTF